MNLYGAAKQQEALSDWTRMGRLCHKVDFVNISDTHLTLMEVGSNGCWNWNSLMTNVPYDIIQLVNQHPPPVIYSEEQHDMWIWNDSKTRVYTCKAGYDWLLARNRTWNMTDDWNWVCKIKEPAKIQHFIWLRLHEALPVNSVRRRCNLTNSALCGSCLLTNEDVLHCLRDCHFVREIWKDIPIRYTRHFFSTSMTKDWIKEGLQSQPPQFFMSTLWWVWRWRTHRILGDNKWKKYDVLRNIHTLHENIDYYQLGKGRNAKIRNEVRWEPPQPGLVKLNVDGSCNSRGEICNGGIIRDDKCNWFTGFSSNDGQGDVLFAELFAIYHGISLLLQHGHSRAIIESDSLEAIQLLTQTNELEFHEYSSLLLRITSLINHASDMVLHHIYREANLSVDWLEKYENSSAMGITNK